MTCTPKHEFCHVKHSFGGKKMHVWGVRDIAPPTLNLSTRWKWEFDVHVTVHHDKFLIIKPTRCTNFSNLFLKWNSYMFQTVPLSIVSFSLYTQQLYMSYSFVNSCQAGSGWSSNLILLASSQQTYMTYTIAVCTVKNWRWTEELSETCKSLIPKITSRN
jgi:hypothetical protein